MSDVEARWEARYSPDMGWYVRQGESVEATWYPEHANKAHELAAYLNALQAQAGLAAEYQLKAANWQRDAEMYQVSAKRHVDLAAGLRAKAELGEAYIAYRKAAEYCDDHPSIGTSAEKDYRQDLLYEAYDALNPQPHHEPQCVCGHAKDKHTEPPQNWPCLGATRGSDGPCECQGYEPNTWIAQPHHEETK